MLSAELVVLIYTVSISVLNRQILKLINDNDKFSDAQCGFMLRYVDCEYYFPLNAIKEKGLNIKSQKILVYCKGMQLAFSLF